MSLKAVHMPELVNLSYCNKGVCYNLWPNDDVSFMQFIHKCHQRICPLQPHHTFEAFCFVLVFFFHFLCGV